MHEYGRSSFLLVIAYDCLCFFIAFTFWVASGLSASSCEAFGFWTLPLISKVVCVPSLDATPFIVESSSTCPLGPVRSPGLCRLHYWKAAFEGLHGLKRSPPCQGVVPLLSFRTREVTKLELSSLMGSSPLRPLQSQVDSSMSMGGPLLSIRTREVTMFEPPSLVGSGLRRPLRSQIGSSMSMGCPPFVP